MASIDANYDEIWAKSCLEFNERAFDLIGSEPSIRYVIMSSPFSGYLDEGELKIFHNGKSTVSDRSVALSELARTVQGLQARGKLPILVAPPPRPGFDVGGCRQQTGTGLVVLGRNDCDFRLAEYEIHQRGIIAGLKEVQLRTGARVVWLDGPMCADSLCRTATSDGISIYKDGGHLSIPGAAWLIPQLGLEELMPEPT